MKKPKSKLILIGIVLIGAISFASAKKMITESFGNAELMRENLNFPNAVNPAMNNFQKYEKDGIMLDRNNHPKEDLGSKYNRERIK
jgi:hypothetical protein